MLTASLVWKYISGFCAVPLVTGWFGFNPLFLKFSSASLSTNLANSSYSKTSIFCTSWEVLNPSKKFINGILHFNAVKCATGAKSITSCTEPSASIAYPVARADITSWWSPKIFNEDVASALAATWITPGSLSPAILYIFGIIKSNPCDAV